MGVDIRQRATRIRTAAIAGLILCLCFGAYATLAPPRFQGYEDETAGVAEGIFSGEGARIPEGTRVRVGSLPQAERETGRAGIVQPLLMVPFHAAGLAADEVLNGGDDYTYRSFFLRLYSAAITALAAALLFLLVRVLGRSEGWAISIALLFAFASIAMPYALIGMEPTGTCVVIGAFLAAAYAARTPRLWPWLLTALLIGAAALTKPPNALGALGALVLLWRPLRQASPDQRRPRLAAIIAPILLGALAFLAYNAYRYDGPFDTGYVGVTTFSPIGVIDAAAGLLASPGKGLLLYSPLAVLGVLGLFTLWRRDRPLAVAILAGMGLGMAPYLTPVWSDETWGPRYLVPIAWLLLVPIAWWATTRRRRLIVGGVAAVAVAVQLAGGLVSYTAQLSTLLSGAQTGVKVHGGLFFNVDEREIPYGTDPVRWVPELSQLLYNGEALASIVGRNLGLGELEGSYTPFRGRATSWDYSEVPLNAWWNPGSPPDPDTPQASRLWLIPFLLLFAGAAAGLWLLRAGRLPATAQVRPRDGLG